MQLLSTGKTENFNMNGMLLFAVYFRLTSLVVWGSWSLLPNVQYRAVELQVHLSACIFNCNECIAVKYFLLYFPLYVR